MMKYLDKEKALREWETYDTKEKLIHKTKRKIKEKQDYSKRKNIFRRP